MWFAGRLFSAGMITSTTTVQVKNEKLLNLIDVRSNW